MLHLGPVVAGDAWRNGGVGHQLLDARRSEDVGGVLLQRLVVAHHAVVYVAGRAQLRVRHPVNYVLTELAVHAATALHVTQVTDKVLKVQAGGGQGALTVAFAVLTDDGGGDVMFVPRLEAWVLHKLVLEGRNQPLEGISHDEEFKVGAQSVEERNKHTGAAAVRGDIFSSRRVT